MIPHEPPVRQLWAALGLVPGETAELETAVAEYTSALRRRLAGAGAGEDRGPPVVEPPDRSVDYYFQPDGPLAGTVPGWELRAPQLQMARRVARVLSGRGVLLAEAGTGTGKSLAYLVPAAIQAMTTGEPVVVATYTVNLQQQLWTKEIPMLQELLPGLDAAVLLGRSRYPCLDKFLADLPRAPDAVLSPVTLGTRAAWIYAAAGEGQEAGVSGPESWGEAAAVSEDCIGEECEWFHRGCFVIEARRRAGRAHLIVANHALVLSDLRTDSHFLPQYRTIIFDEAHHLPAVAKEQFGIRITGTELAAFLEAVAGHRRGRGRQVVLLPGEAEEARELAKDLLERLPPLFDPMGRLAAAHPMGRAWDWDDLAGAGAQARAAARDLVMGLARLGTMFRRQAAGEDDDRRTRAGLERQAQKSADLAVRLAEATGMSIGEGPEDTDSQDSGGVREPGWQRRPDMVYWLAPATEARGAGSGRPGTDVTLYATPLHVGDIMRERLFAQMETVVFTSATLATSPGGFRFIEEELGLTGVGESESPADHITLPSPFHYRDQALLAIAADMPDPKSPDEFVAAAAEVLPALVRVAGGRTLVLFTSREMLRAVSVRLQEAVAADGIEVLAQGTDSERAAMLRRLARDERTVLLGLQSFWEGVDVSGPALSQVVIVRLPFEAHQNPVQHARLADLERAGKSGFMHLSLPQAVLRFRQGFGRLIRTSTDRGAVVVLDSRLRSARYGKAFIEALPGPRLWCGPVAGLPEAVGLWLSGREPTGGNCGYEE